MSVFLRIDINLVAMAMLGLVFLIAGRSLDKRDLLNRKFLSTSLIIIFVIFCETVTCIINRQPLSGLRPFSILLHLCLYISAPVLTYFWFVFIHSWVIPEGTIPHKKKIVLLIPVVVNTIITALSPFFGLVFSVNSSNVYQRGPLFLVSAVISYIYLICSLILILRQKNKIMKQEFKPLILCSFIPTLGGVVQTLFYGTLLMWSSAAFSLVIVYIYLQKRMIQLDNLTGVWTRGSFDYYISQKVRKNGNEEFGAIYMDLDGLKKINDQFGHMEGDYAIKTAVQLIKDSTRTTDVIARLGGDEFIVVTDSKTKEELDSAVEKIRSTFLSYNNNKEKGYELACSIGADIFNNEYKSIEKFLHHIDSLMYENKKRNYQL